MSNNVEDVISNKADERSESTNDTTTSNIDLNIEKKVKQTIADTLQVDESKVSLDANFSSDLSADSLDLVELVMAFESEFEVDIPDEEASKLLTVQDAINYVKEHVKKHKATL